jgi:hypothetical protein
LEKLRAARHAERHLSVLLPGFTSTWPVGDVFHYGHGRWARSGKVFEVNSD